MDMEQAAVPIFNLGFDDPEVFIEQYRIVTWLLENRHNFLAKRNIYQ
jgi:hypothetical protein